MITIECWSVGSVTIEVNRCSGSSAYWVDMRECGGLVATEPFDTEAKATAYAERVFEANMRKKAS